MGLSTKQREILDLAINVYWYSGGAITLAAGTAGAGLMASGGGSPAGGAILLGGFTAEISSRLAAGALSALVWVDDYNSGGSGDVPGISLGSSTPPSQTTVGARGELDEVLGFLDTSADLLVTNSRNSMASLARFVNNEEAASAEFYATQAALDVQSLQASFGRFAMALDTMASALPPKVQAVSVTGEELSRYFDHLVETKSLLVFEKAATSWLGLTHDEEQFAISTLADLKSRLDIPAELNYKEALGLLAGSAREIQSLELTELFETTS